MEIGAPVRTVIVEPMSNPVPQHEPQQAPKPVETPEPEKVPA